MPVESGWRRESDYYCNIGTSTKSWGNSGEKNDHPALRTEKKVAGNDGRGGKKEVQYPWWKRRKPDKMVQSQEQQARTEPGTSGRGRGR